MIALFGAAADHARICSILSASPPKELSRSVGILLGGSARSLVANEISEGTDNQCVMRLALMNRTGVSTSRRSATHRVAPDPHAPNMARMDPSNAISNV